MVLRCLRAELMKCRRAPVWLAFLVLPPLSPRCWAPSTTWATWRCWTPAGTACGPSTPCLPPCSSSPPSSAACAWQWRLEHADHNWNAASPPRCQCVRCTWQAAAGPGGVRPGHGPHRPALSPQRQAGRYLRPSAPGAARLAGLRRPGLYGGVRRTALLSGLGHPRLFAPPVAIALVGGIFGLLLTSQGFGAAFPYSLLYLGMRANNPQMALPLPSFLAGCGFYLLLFSLLAVRRLSRRDAVTG